MTLKMAKKITRSNGKVYTLKENKDRYFNPEEYLKVFETLSKKQKHTATVLINTGARINEAQHIKISDIRFSDKEIQGSKGWIELTETKTKASKGEKKGKPRTIIISNKFEKYLKPYIKKNKLKDEDTLKLISNVAINNGLKKAALESKIRNPNDFSAHSLRKTLETWLMAMGISDIVLLRHFGHDIRTAASHYVSPDIFNYQQKNMMRDIIGNLYER